MDEDHRNQAELISSFLVIALLDEEDQKELEKGFERVEEEVMGPGVHERYHKMIEQWEQKYG